LGGPEKKRTGYSSNGRRRVGSYPAWLISEGWFAFKVMRVQMHGRYGGKNLPWSAYSMTGGGIGVNVGRIKAWVAGHSTTIRAKG